MTAMRGRFGRSLLAPLIYGLITGVICGVFLTLFLICSKIIIHFAFGLYETRDSALVVVCILTLAILCCLLTAVIQTLCPRAKGSGIPLAEGSARGMLRVKWLSTAAALIAGSFLSFACGMPLGSEGPSVGVGALIGDGVGKTAKRPTELKRYLITGGASAGLAVAFNAPLTGICFAFEEAHRRFSPGIIASALSAVIAAVITSQLAFWGFGQIPYLEELGVEAGFCLLPFLKQTAFKNVFDMLKICGAAIVCGGVCALFGTCFNRLTETLSKLFGKIKSNTLRLLPAFMLSAVCGLSLYLLAGTGEATLASVGTSSAVWLLVTVLAVRFVTTATASGAGATGGLFLPMIAIGGIIGIISAKICVACGMSEAYSANVIMMCVCAYFASSVRAPITGIALSIELTASFANLLPCVLAVGAATVIAELTKTEPLYEHALEKMVARAPLPKSARNSVATGIVSNESPIAFKRIRNILWPYNSLVTDLERNGNSLVPDGETVLRPGDKLTIRAENVDPEVFKSEVNEFLSSCNDT